MYNTLGFFSIGDGPFLQIFSIGDGPYCDNIF